MLDCRASSRAKLEESSVSTVDRMYTTWIQTLVHDIFVFQFVHSQTQMTCITHSSFSVPHFWIETALEPRVVTTAGFQKEKRSNCHV